LFSKEPIEEEVWVVESEHLFGPDWAWDFDPLAMKLPLPKRRHTTSHGLMKYWLSPN